MIIWKFRLQEGINQIEVPHNSIVLSVQAQPKGCNDLVLWMLIDTKERWKEMKTIFVIETGHEVKVGEFETIESLESLKFIDTVQLEDRLYVLHIFEVL